MVATESRVIVMTQPEGALNGIPGAGRTPMVWMAGGLATMRLSSTATATAGKPSEVEGSHGWALQRSSHRWLYVAIKKTTPDFSPRHLGSLAPTTKLAITRNLRITLTGLALSATRLQNEIRKDGVVIHRIP